MSSCAIMQPTYLPWAGYFNLIASVDYFVLLDDVQFVRSSWQHRNRISLNGSEHMISIPVKKIALEEAILHRVTICSNQNFRSQHWKVLQHAYRKAPFGTHILQILEEFYQLDNSEKLTLFTGQVIRRICEMLAIKTPIAYASEIDCSGRRSDHVANICRHLECDTYLSPKGAINYLEEDEFAKKHGINLLIQEFSARPYPQYRSENFISHLSIIDVIANIGLEKTREYIGAKK